MLHGQLLYAFSWLHAQWLVWVTMVTSTDAFSIYTVATWVEDVLQEDLFLLPQ